MFKTIDFRDTYVDMNDVAVGDTIYVDSSIYTAHPEDSVIGGLATVIEINPHYGTFYTMHVRTAEHHDNMYRWSILRLRQDDLKEMFGNERACRNPYKE